MRLKFYYSDGGVYPPNGRVYLSGQKIVNNNNDDENELNRYQNYFANTIGMLTNDIDDCERILKEIESIENSVDKNITIQGNDLDVVLSGNEIQVNINLDDDWVGQPEGRFKISQFKAAMIARCRFLTLPKSLESVVEIDI